MGNQTSDFDDIRRTGDKAQRLLRDLEAGFESGANASSPQQPTPYISKPVSDRPYANQSSGQQPANPVTFLVVFALIVIPVIAVVSNSNKPVTVDDSVPTLRFRATCGSKYSVTGRWWPVLGPRSRSVLSRVRRDYCGDAYINAEGNVQVASFGSQQAADDFSKRLTASMQVPFRVGKERKL